MAGPDKQIRTLINASGFAFQIAVEDVIRRTASEHRWSILATEHPWADKGGFGFIDLILCHQITHVVIECKRVRDAAWVFLLPRADRRARATPQTMLSWTAASPSLKPLTGVDEFVVAPESHQARYCVVRGTGENERPLLERLAAGLIRATDALALQQLALDVRHTGATATVLLPVIVTTAHLYVAEVEPTLISLEDGTVKDFETSEVSYVRFRKPLESPQNDRVPREDERNLGDINTHLERSVFVVTATQLVGFLQALDCRIKTGKTLWQSLTSGNDDWGALR